MKNILKEGQTQVYANGMVIPQHGVNTNAPHLNNVSQQLLDIIHTLYTSGTPKKDSVVLSVLVGMGIEQQLAISGINAYKMQMNPVQTNENKTNQNNRHMKFTLASLYENVTNCISELKQITSDKSRISYSTESAVKILEGTLQNFPMRFKNEVSSVISEEIENSVNPALKFRIAKKLHKQLSIVEWVTPVKNLREFIEHSYQENLFLFRVNESLETMETQRGPLLEKLSNAFNSLLRESNEAAKSKFQVIANKNPWSGDCKAIANELRIAESKLVDTSKGKLVKVLSPVLVNENGMSFYLHNKVYTINEGEITEGVVNDVRFYNVIEGLKLFKRDGDSIVTFGENGKCLEYNLKEGKLTLGNTDMTNASIMELSESLLAMNFSGYRNINQNDVLCRFFESIDLLFEMDNFTTIQSQEWLNVFLTMISIDENIFINKVNPGMQLNEMKKVGSATEAVKITKEFINFDITNVLSEKLIAENYKSAIRNKKIQAINEKLSFVEGEIVKVSNAIKSFGENLQLKGARELLESEIRKIEVELADAYITNESAITKGMVIQNVTLNGNSVTVKTDEKSFKVTSKNPLSINGDMEDGFGKAGEIKTVKANKGRLTINLVDGRVIEIEDGKGEDLLIK